MKHCIIYLSEKPVPIADDYAHEYARAFTELEFEVTLINLVEPTDVFEKICRSIKSNTLFILSVHGNGFAIDLDGVNIYEYFGIPFIHINIDHIFINSKIPLANKPYIVYGLFDAFDKYYMSKYFSKARKCFFSPSGGCLYNGDEISFEKREYDIMFCGTVTNCDKYVNEIKGWGDPLYLKILEAAEEIALGDENKSDIEAVEKAMCDYNISVEYFGTKLHMLVLFFSFYTRNYKRLAFLNSLAEKNFKIHCFGNPGSFNKLNGKNLIIHERLTTLEYLRALSNSRIVLNTSPLIGYGATERLFSGMLNGAAVVTDTNEYINSEFTDGKSMIAYSHGNYEIIADKLEHLLQTPKELQEIAFNGKKIAQERHTFLQRARNIANVMETGILQFPQI